jgi:hypothetical protein
MWFLPILVFGAIAVAVARRSSRAAAPPSRQLPAPRAPERFLSEPASLPPSVSPLPPGVSPLPPGVPGPISVLGEIIKVGRTPPPTVVLCAIAEAQAIGRDDLASDIVMAFVAPVVAQRQRMRSRTPHAAPGYARGSCAVARSPREAADATVYPVHPARACLVVPPPDSVLRRHDATPPAGPPSVTPSPVQQTSAASQAPAPAPAPTAAPPPASPTPQGPLTTVTDNDILALLDSDPARFMDLVSKAGGTMPTKVTVGSVVPPSMEAPMTAPPVVPAQAMGLSPETVARMQEAAGLAQAAARTRAMAPGSPIPGIADSAWQDFVIRLERESPQFASSKHVGKYRQRRERLAELGINPAVIQNSSEAQRQALDADLADAHRHGVASELFAQHLGRPIALPNIEGQVTITLSGVLGVIQYAGLDGAAGWLEHPNDRKRFPHTTQAFLHTNGVF